MYSFIQPVQEFTFSFEDTPFNCMNYIQPELKFQDSELLTGLYGEVYKHRVSCDQDSVKNNKSTHEYTFSERETYNDLTPVTVNFIDSQPDLNQLERIVSSQISEKGYNNVVLDCLDIFEEDETEEDQDIIRKKQKKSRSQIRALKSEFKRNPNWTKRSMKKLAKDLNLTAAQVYKWHWDETKKADKKAKSQSTQNYKRFKSE